MTPEICVLHESDHVRSRKAHQKTQLDGRNAQRTVRSRSHGGLSEHKRELLDLCYTKAHVDTFVILSGDSDFSPLVSKLRENNRCVIGVGVKTSTSDLLTANCDEFLFYDDLVRAQEQKQQRAAKHATGPTTGGAQKRTPKTTVKDKHQEAVDLILETMEALLAERGEEDKIWGSMVKQALKRRQPGFNESYYGFRSFSALLEEAAQRQLLALERDEKSGGYLLRLLAQEG